MTAMVVMESGSDWPGQVDDSTHVVAFSQGPEDLLRRTHEKLDAIRRRERGALVAVLACSTATGGATAGSRAELARALLRAVRSASHGRLILSANRRASRDLRQELLELAGALSSELHGSSATICVRFTETPPKPASRTLVR
jgi:hypothetical protein